MFMLSFIFSESMLTFWVEANLEVLYRLFIYALPVKI